MSTIPLARRNPLWPPSPTARHYALLVLLLAILALLLLYPIATLLKIAFLQNDRFTLDWFRSVLSNPIFISKLLTSLGLAAVVTLFANLIAFPLALIHRRWAFPGKTILSALLLLPLVLPPFVGAVGMKQILSKFGSFTIALQYLHILGPHDGVNWLLHGGFWACAVLISLGLYPIAYLNLQASLANIDPAMLEAAQNLGGTRLTNFRRITLPLAMPGIFAGSTIIFIWAFTELGTPLLLDYPNVASREIFDSLAAASGGNNPEAFTKVLCVLVLSCLAYLVGKTFLGSRGHAMTSKAATTTAATPLSLLPGLLAAAPFLLVTVLAVLPHISVVLYSVTATAVERAHGWGPDGSFGWYRTILPSRYTAEGYHAIFRDPEIIGSILNSLKYAAVSTTFDLILGIAIAWILVRTKIWGRTALDSLSMLPLAIPGLVMAFGFIAVIPNLALALNYLHVNTLLHMKPFDAQYFRVNPFIILAIAYAIRRMPYLVRSTVGGLQQTSVTLEEAAANLGSPPFRTLRKITLPLIAANLIAGAVLTFAFSMLEVSDSIILAQFPAAFPITKKIYSLATDTSGPDNLRNACALGVLAMLLLASALITANALLGKRLGALFRF